MHGAVNLLQQTADMANCACGIDVQEPSVLQGGMKFVVSGGAGKPSDCARGCKEQVRTMQALKG